ncbi:MAG TPA: hypothetical protein VGS41_04440, partial [Chthonomonadales bacterium]|nr:hypothetical protein [Chthonomonadales bacterium]
MNLPAIRQLAISIGDDQVSQFTNAGLVLDRFAAYRNEACKEFDQKDQNQHIQRVIKANKKNLQANFGILGAWRSLFDALPSPKREWTQATVWRLAAHLARATSLENGSACLHPIYGFPFLPGS